MLMNDTDDVELDPMAWSVAECVRETFDPEVEIDPITADEFYVASKGFVAEIRVGASVELVGHFPVDEVCRIPLCDPESLDLIVEQLRKWMPGR